MSHGAPVGFVVSPFWDLAVDVPPGVLLGAGAGLRCRGSIGAVGHGSWSLRRVQIAPGATTPPPATRPRPDDGYRGIVLWNEAPSPREKNPLHAASVAATTPHFPSAIHASVPKSPACSRRKLRTPRISAYCFRRRRNPLPRKIIKHPRGYLPCVCICCTHGKDLRRLL